MVRYLPRSRRRQSAFVLQQRDGLSRGLAGEFAMVVASDDALGHGGIDVRIVEEAEFELPQQHGRDQLVELRFLQYTLLYQLDQMQIAIRVGQLDVYARFDGEFAGLLLVAATKWP